MSYAIHLPTPLILSAIAVDAIMGDPKWLPHPVRLIGWVIKQGETLVWSGSERRDYWNGAILTAVVIAGATGITWTLVAIASFAGTWFQTAVAVTIAWTTIAVRGLDRAAAAVERALQAGDLDGARREIRALVGRDPESLDRTGLIRAAVESVAENCSDGVIAPILYLFIGGPVAAITYKAINTLDSMIGYIDDRYRWFGNSAARLDDVANLLPARISAICLMGAAVVFGRGVQAYRSCITTAALHRSPNAGYPESSMAGALGIQLGGDATYGGVVEHRALLGIAERAPLISDVAAARAMMKIATIVAFCLFALTRIAVFRVVAQLR